MLYRPLGPMGRLRSITEQECSMLNRQSHLAVSSTKFQLVTICNRFISFFIVIFLFSYSFGKITNKNPYHQKTSKKKPLAKSEPYHARNPVPCGISKRVGTNCHPPFDTNAWRQATGDTWIEFGYSASKWIRVP